MFVSPLQTCFFLFEFFQQLFLFRYVDRKLYAAVTFPSASLMGVAMSSYQQGDLFM